MPSKVDKLREQVAEARKRRSAGMSALQDELKVEVAKAKKGKGSKNEKPAESPNDS